jgi:EAL domain-containing protein (putative c-di-GMP-specific phosphodiesterase class I)
VFDHDHAQIDVTRHRLAAAMPVALERGEFEPFFQPLLTLADRRITGVEALARWRRPATGVLDPEHFIVAAETTGLIRPLGQTLLEQACRRGGDWRARGHDLLISVNLSPRQLDDPDLVAAVMEALDRADLPAERLQLEITESAAVEHHRGVLDELAELDIRLALDDYGTGYSNLASLSRLPVTMVKLAASLITDLDDGDNAAAVAVVRHVIQLCHALNITVTAEGIETEAQYLRLRDLGCDYGQGYLFARPGPAGVINGLLEPGAAPET